MKLTMEQLLFLDDCRDMMVKALQWPGDGGCDFDQVVTGPNGDKTKFTLRSEPIIPDKE